MTVPPWPEVRDEHRWTIEMMEEELGRNTQTAGELSDRARELREKAADTDINAYREVWQVLAARYEAIALTRSASI